MIKAINYTRNHNFKCDVLKKFYYSMHRRLTAVLRWKYQNWFTLDDVKFFSNNQNNFINSLRTYNTNSIITLNYRSFVFMHTFESKSPSISTIIISSPNISWSTKDIKVKLSILKGNIICNDYLLYFDNNICVFNF